ncbi:hypothetical protein pb186bvf_002846 [Paramecium bursaria]
MQFRANISMIYKNFRLSNLIPLVFKSLIQSISYKQYKDLLPKTQSQ